MSACTDDVILCLERLEDKNSVPWEGQTSRETLQPHERTRGPVRCLGACETRGAGNKDRKRGMGACASFKAAGAGQDAYT